MVRILQVTSALHARPPKDTQICPSRHHRVDYTLETSTRPVTASNQRDCAFYLALLRGQAAGRSAQSRAIFTLKTRHYRVLPPSPRRLRPSNLNAPWRSCYQMGSCNLFGTVVKRGRCRPCTVASIQGSHCAPALDAGLSESSTLFRLTTTAASTIPFKLERALKKPLTNGILFFDWLYCEEGSSHGVHR